MQPWGVAVFHQPSACQRRAALASVVLLGLVSTATVIRQPVDDTPTATATPLAVVDAAPQPRTVPGPLPAVARAGGDLLHHLQATPPVTEARPAPPAPSRPVKRVEVASGDTLLRLLTRAGITDAEAHAVVDGLRDVYDPRRLRPGQRLEIETDAAARSLVRLAFAPTAREEIELVRDGSGLYAAARSARPTTTQPAYATAVVQTSLHAAGRGEDVPADVLADLVKLFSWDVDFQRETRPGDRLAVLYEELRLDDGALLEGGDILYARLEVGGRTLEAFRFERDGLVEHFDRDGRSLRKFLLRTPVAAGRVSSGYGMRRHPILGYNRMHRGVDFAAPTGTPIIAAGSGRVVRAGRLGGYGNYIRIQHGSGYATAYAHLSRFADGLKAGSRVRQGDVIGYVGSTGRSTGPHLHFEVLRDGRQVNPLEVAQPPAERLDGAKLEAFQAVVRATEVQIAELSGVRTFAEDARTPVRPSGG